MNSQLHLLARSKAAALNYYNTCSIRLFKPRLDFIFNLILIDLHPNFGWQKIHLKITFTAFWPRLQTSCNGVSSVFQLLKWQLLECLNVLLNKEEKRKKKELVDSSSPTHK